MAGDLEGPEPARFRNSVSRLARAVVDWAGSGTAAIAAVLLIACWAVVGALAGFSDHWLAVLAAVTGATTFVMVFFIQHTAERDFRAVLLKLDELVRATEGAGDHVVGTERGPLHEQEHFELDRDRRHAARDGDGSPS